MIREDMARLHALLVVAACGSTPPAPKAPPPIPAPPVHEIRSLGLAGGDYLLFMGRISPEKGCDVLIEAFRRLGRKMKLVVAGYSSYTDAYVERLRGAAPRAPTGCW